MCSRRGKGAGVADVGQYDPEVLHYFNGKRVVITGGIGSVGRSLVDQLLEMEVRTVRVIDNNESGLFDYEMSCVGGPRVEFFHADICDTIELDRTFGGMDCCFHAAALKHVPSCERSPFSAINTNIIGVSSVIRAAINNGLDRILFTSSDKAVNPTNVMGTSKLMGERLFTASNFLEPGGNDGRKTVFASTRFGNVAGSRGSVLPLFCRQIELGGPVTLTDERMSRFMMSMEQSVRLVIESMAYAKLGEVFITKMPVLRIKDLARVLIRMLAPVFGHDPNKIEIKVTGRRPGEKLWEELSTDEESGRILESEKYLIVLPALADPETLEKYRYASFATHRCHEIYHSDRERPMTEAEIEDFLLMPTVLSDTIRDQVLALRS
jgi:FlaA1/EpsC-like NDP-sugar epimerase